MATTPNLSAWMLSSGSEGNCIYIRAGKDEILIDAGISARAISRALAELGSELANISDIFITHEHIDHVRALPQLIKRTRARIHMTEASAKASKLEHFVLCHPPLYEETCGAITVRSFKTSHDSAMSVGYTVEACGERLGIATDTGYVSRGMASALCGVNYAVIEANHDPDMLIRGGYPAHLKERILSNFGHLSNEDCSRLACYLAENGAKRIVLAHLSKDNNTPELALAACRDPLSALGVTPLVAARKEVTVIC